MKKHTFKIVLAAYLISMVVAISIFNDTSKDNAVDVAMHSPQGEAVHQEAAVDLLEDAKRVAERQAYLEAVLERIAGVDNRKP